jgi:hypothetical protein
LSAKVPEASPRQKRDIAHIRRKSRWVMANLSRMRGSISLDGNEVCHVALLKRIGKEGDRGRWSVAEWDWMDSRSGIRFPNCTHKKI